MHDRQLPGTSVTIKAASVVAVLRAGHPFDQAAVRITGSLDLRALQVVSSSFRCRWCVIDGALLAPDVTFREVVDLSGTKVKGPVDFRGAMFDRALAWRDGKVRGAALFGSAVFRDSVAFDNTTFASTEDLSGADFRAAASFALANFAETVSFAGATFSGTAVFTGSPPGRHKAPAASRCETVGFGAFAAAAVFTNATFAGLADFRDRCFAGRAEFSDVLAGGAMVFDGAEFAGPADFERGVFGADVSFGGALFRGNADFANVSAQHDLVFDDAQLLGDTDLSGATINGTLSFRFVTKGKVLYVDCLSTGSLVLDLGKISWLPPTAVGDEIDILQRVEVTARNRGQTAVANNARFMWLDLSRRTHHDAVANIADLVFYRWIAGYLVKPLSPLRALLFVVALTTLVRMTATVVRWSRAPIPEPPDSSVSAAPALDGLGCAYGLGSASRPDPAGHKAPPAGSGQPGTWPKAPSAAWKAATAVWKIAAAFAGTLPGALQDSLAVVVPRLPKSNTTGPKGPSRPSAPGHDGATPEHQPTQQQATPSRTGGSYLCEFMRLVEWITVKALLGLFLLCVANANATLHQFIEAILNR
ncbi:MAG TPA: pentapeptide repeat-containing protein [Streptosporangiaceae bacterium]|nr:pentapeptide repeat-containing protein [Streptosporangiaceae bacterium]